MAYANFPQDEIATVVCNGAAYSNWKRVRVDFEVGRAWAEFQFTAVEGIEAVNGQFSNLSGIQIWPRDPVQVLLAGKTIVGAGDSAGNFMAGVEVRQSAFTATEHAVMLFGRDHTRNCVDCSIRFGEGEGQYINKSFTQIAADVLAKSNTGFLAPHGDNGYIYPYFSVAPGETGFAAVERLMRYQPGMRSWSDGAGNLVCDFLSGASSNNFAPPSAAFEFIEGTNILQSTATIDITKSLSLVEAIAQQPATGGTSSKEVVENKGYAYDPTVEAGRYLKIQCEEPATSQGCTLRAQHEITYRAQEIIHCMVKVKGWFARSGQNFDIYQPYNVWSPSHNLFRGLWSRKVTFELNDQDGSTTTIELCTWESLNPGGIVPAVVGDAETLGLFNANNGPFFGQGVTQETLQQARQAGFVP